MTYTATKPPTQTAYQLGPRAFYPPGQARHRSVVRRAWSRKLTADCAAESPSLPQHESADNARFGGALTGIYDV